MNGTYYVYALKDPRNNEIFYIGKGINNRVFAHEVEAGKDTASEKAKIQRINEIKNSGNEVQRFLLQTNLTEEGAFDAESAAINLLNLQGKLSNIVSGHGELHEATSVEEFDKLYGAEELKKDDITDNLLCIKINRLYNRGDDINKIYEDVRGYWHIGANNLDKIEYVLAVYEGLVVGVFKPYVWGEIPLLSLNCPRRNAYKNFADLCRKEDGRKFFVGDEVKNSKYMDKSVKTYLGDRNPIRYLWKKED